LAGEQTMAGKEFEMFLMTNDTKRSYLDFTLKTSPGDDMKDAEGPGES
jgi:hypothetical protein